MHCCLMFKMTFQQKAAVCLLGLLECPVTNSYLLCALDHKIVTMRYYPMHRHVVTVSSPVHNKR